MCGKSARELQFYIEKKENEMAIIKREAKRILLSLIHKGTAFVEESRVASVLSFYNDDVIVNEVPKETKSIRFIVTRFVRFHGGQTSLLRLGTKLSGLGFDVSYAVYKPQTKAEMEACVSSLLSDYKGGLIPPEELFSGNPGVVVASSWDTVAIAKKFQNAYKVYFVQDYEPYFYPFGELFLLAKRTYEQGLHMVSLGSWNKRMIERECNPVSPVDAVSFPYEASEYAPMPRDFDAYRSKKTLRLAVYLKQYGKRLPNLLPVMLTDLSDRLMKDGITLEISYYGEAKVFKAKNGRNLGMLNKSQLHELYASSDFGIVASMTNISLVPYEMLSSGLPVIEFADGTFCDFFPAGAAACLTGFSGESLYRGIRACLDDPLRIENSLLVARDTMKDLSWQRTAEEFAAILRRLPTKH